jgi:multicomponent Na+:H+ antiporter subunit C
MDTAIFFALAGVGLFCIGLRALVLQAHLLRKVLAVNLMGSGAFLVLVGPAERGDPVPQAMVITGIVVAVSATALALNLMLKVVNGTGSARLDAGRGDDRPSGDAE